MKIWAIFFCVRGIVFFLYARGIVFFSSHQPNFATHFTQFSVGDPARYEKMDPTGSNVL